MVDLEKELRKAVFGALKAGAPLTAIVPATSIYPQAPPADAAWPLVKPGVAIVTGFDGTSFAGARIRYTIYSLAKAKKSGTTIIETAEDHVGRIDAAVKGLLHLRRFAIPGGSIHLRYISGQRRQDGDERDAWRAVSEFRAKVMAA